MFDNSVIRIVSVLVVMAVVGFGWYIPASQRLKKTGSDDKKARSQVELQAKKYSLIAAFLYMVAMVSVAGLFI